MNYRKFEALLTGAGLAVILATIVTSYINQSGYVEILGQAMFGPVLFIALHYGRKAGFLSALAAALFFIIAKFYSQDQSFSTLVPELILARTAIFGLVGIIGGELAHWMKYLILKFEDEDLIDSQTNLYSKDYTATIIEKNIENYNRRSRYFSIALVNVSSNKSFFFDNVSKKKVMEGLALSLRENVRLVDDIGRWDDEMFCIVFPDTNTNEANIAVDRVKKKLAQKLNEILRKIELDLDLETDILTFPDDRERIFGLLDPIIEKNSTSKYGLRLGEKAL